MAPNHCNVIMSAIRYPFKHWLVAHCSSQSTPRLLGSNTLQPVLVLAINSHFGFWRPYTSMMLHEAQNAVAANPFQETLPLLQTRRASFGKWMDTMKLSAAQGIIVLCMAIFGFTQITFLAPWAQRGFVERVSVWWEPNIPESPDDDDKDNSFLLTSPGPFVLLFGIFPLMISVILHDLVVCEMIELHWRPSSILWRVSAFLGRKAKLPHWFGDSSIGEVFFIALFLGAGNATVVWYAVESQLGRVQGRYGVGTLDTALGITGIAFGYSCMFNFASLLLPTARNFTWLAAANVSYANGIKYHRWFGWAVLLTLALHIVPFYWLWYRQGTLLALSLPCFSCSLEYMSPGYAAWMIVFGEVSTLLLIILGVTSIPSIRRQSYQTFAKGHRLAGLSMLFAVLHWAPMLWWLLPAMIPVYVQKIKAFNNIQGPRMIIEECVLLDGGIIKIIACHKHGEEHQLGQFVYLVVPSLDPEQMHPITIASAPKLHEIRFTLLIKELGDWTRDLAQYIAESSSASSLEQLDIRLDGFYGASLVTYQQYPVVCLLGGGIGATPLFAILENLLAERLRPRHTVRHKHVFVSLVFRELSLLEYIHPVLMALKQTDPCGDVFSINIHLTCKPRDEELSRAILVQSSHLHLKNGYPLGKVMMPRLESQQTRSAITSALSYVLSFAFATFFLVWLEEDGGVLARWTNESKYWPIQRIIGVFSLGITSRLGVVVAAKLAGAECRERESTRVSSPQHIPSEELQAPECDRTHKEESLTLQGMLKAHNVRFGRPNVREVIADVKMALGSCREGQVAGIFMSGPPQMKQEANRAVAELGTASFEVHEEEFEL